ncbi:MAG: chemotaxis protein CheD [Candidatus Hydrogenedentes bacterium]|nr:chemotaxis protein CheD [Candidatus Hydrogenedentota bacterium]
MMGTKMDGADTSGYFLEPGYMYFSRYPVKVRTVLGSSVTVCIWDRRRRYGGINHFLYPSIKDPSLATPKYGNVAVPALIRIMKEEGCSSSDLVAQIFGGADPKGSKDTELGVKNVDIARRALSAHKIAVISEDVGGVMGRKIIFDIGSGEAAVLKVHQIRKTDWLVEPDIELAKQEG